MAMATQPLTGPIHPTRNTKCTRKNRNRTKFRAAKINSRRKTIVIATQNKHKHKPPQPQNVHFSKWQWGKSRKKTMAEHRKNGKWSSRWRIGRGNRTGTNLHKQQTTAYSQAALVTITIQSNVLLWKSSKENKQQPAGEKGSNGWKGRKRLRAGKHVLIKIRCIFHTAELFSQLESGLSLRLRSRKCPKLTACHLRRRRSGR